MDKKHAISETPFGSNVKPETPTVIEKGIAYYCLLLCALFYTRGVAVIIYEAI